LAPFGISLALHAALVAGVGAWGGHRIETSPAMPGKPQIFSDLVGVTVVGARKPERAQTVALATPEEITDAAGGGLVAPTDPSGSAQTPAKEIAPRAAADTSGSDGTASEEFAAYITRIRSRIGENLRYPLSLRRRGVQGRVGLKLTLSPEGQVQAKEVSEPSGSAELDALALEAASAAQPYPVPMDTLRKKVPLVLNLPIEFKLR
jgi:TonB family protein